MVAVDGPSLAVPSLPAAHASHAHTRPSLSPFSPLALAGTEAKSQVFDIKHRTAADARHREDDDADDAKPP